MGELLNTEDILEYLQVSRTTLHRLRENGLPSKKVGRAVRFSKKDVDEWLSRNESKEFLELGSLFNRHGYYTDMKRDTIYFYSGASIIEDFGYVIFNGPGQSTTALGVGEMVGVDFSPFYKDVVGSKLRLMCKLLGEAETEKEYGQISEKNKIKEIDIHSYFDLSYGGFTAFRDNTHLIPLYKSTAKQWLNGSTVRFVVVPFYPTHEQRISGIMNFIEKMKEQEPRMIIVQQIDDTVKDTKYFGSSFTRTRKGLVHKGTELLVDFGQFRGHEDTLTKSLRDVEHWDGIPYGHHKLFFDIYLKADKNGDGWAEIDKGIWLRVKGINLHDDVYSLWSIIKSPLQKEEKISVEFKIEPGHAKRVLRIFEVKITGPSYYDMSDPVCLFNYS